VRIIDRMPPLLTWHVSQTIMDSLSLIVSTCVFNQSMDIVSLIMLYTLLFP
jgi:hypothetical protein